MALPKVINIQRYDVDSKKCPQSLRLVLRHDIRDVFSRRREFAYAVLSNVGIDALIDKWWEHHQNILRAASIRPEWDWKTLSLLFDENVARPVNFYEAQKDFLILTGRPNYLERGHFSAWNFSTEHVCSNKASYGGYLGEFHEMLYGLYFRAFRYIILENKDVNETTEFSNDDARLSSPMVNEVKSFINEHFTEDQRGAFCNKGINTLLGEENFIPFNKLPKTIFNKISSLRGNDDGYMSFIASLKSYFYEHFDDFLADLYKSVGAHQMAGNDGPVKTTLCNKLVKSFYDWLTALTVGFSGNPYSLVDNEFDFYVNQMKSFVFFTDNPLKVRQEGREGFELVEHGTFDQIFARLQENVKGSFTRESFIVSFHPCDMITCSLGYNWSSCQSWIDDFTDLPSGYGVGSNYQGMYNRGNFQFLCGNAFIAYVPYEKLTDVPQYLWAKKKRCIIWVGDNLDCMRQNYFYPGKPTDQETLAFGKVIREYIQNVCAPFNFSNGTMDWKVKKNVGRDWNSNIEDTDFNKFEEYYDPTPGRYDDPIMALSYLKTAKGTPSLNYALTFPRLDTGLCSTTHSNRALLFFSNTRGTCPICGKHTSRGGICSNCSKELIEHNGQMVHPSDLVSINVGGVLKYFDITELEKLSDYVVVDDGTAVEFKSAFKVFMPSGIKYFKVLPDYVKQCKVCKEYFHPSFMIGDVCIEHFNTALNNGSADDVVVNIDEVLKAFLAGTLSFDCNDTDNLLALLRLLDIHNIKWVSGVKASDYVPRTANAKRMFLSLNKGKLILSSQSKSTVIKVSNLFKKGGE